MVRVYYGIQIAKTFQFIPQLGGVNIKTVNDQRLAKISKKFNKIGNSESDTACQDLCIICLDCNPICFMCLDCFCDDPNEVRTMTSNNVNTTTIWDPTVSIN